MKNEREIETMTKFTTITELQILYAAYHQILGIFSTESERNERLKHDGIPNKITQYRVNKLQAQLDELHEEIVRLEQNENA